MKISHYFRFALIAAILIIPLLFMNITPGAVSEIDNKFLPDFPSFDEGWGGFFPKFNDYLSDRLGFRSALITAQTIINDRIFYVMEHPSYQYGKEGYVFSKLGRYAEDYDFLDAFTDHLLHIQTYCEERQIPFLYLLKPSKTTVYQRYLPEGYRLDNQRLAYLQASLREKSINYVDLTEYFIDLSYTEQIYNQKYDAGHWNELGAYYGVNQLLERMNALEPSIVPHSFEDFEITQELKTSLPVSNFPIEEMVPKFIVKKNSFEEIDLGLANEVDISSQHRSFLRYHSEADNEIDLLIFHGSYFNNSGYKFLASAVENYQNIHNYQNLLNFSYYYNLFRPNFVVVTTAEYATTANYFDMEQVQPLNTMLVKEDYQPAGQSIGPADILKQQYVTLVRFKDLDIDYGYYAQDDVVYDLIHEDENIWTLSFLNEHIQTLDGTLYLAFSDGRMVMTPLTEE